MNFRYAYELQASIVLKDLSFTSVSNEAMMTLRIADFQTTECGNALGSH